MLESPEWLNCTILIYQLYLYNLSAYIYNLSAICLLLISYMFIIHPLLILSTLKHSVKIFGDFLKMTNVKVPMGKMLTTSNTRIIYAK